MRALRVWITVVGMSPFAVINTLWAACKQDNYLPEKIYLIKNMKVEKNGNVDKVKDWMTRILKNYGVNPEILEVVAEETDFERFREALGEIIRGENISGNEVAIDMTPGRKFMSALAMYYGMDKDGVERVYYLHLEDANYNNIPFVEIPFSKQKLFEMKGYLGGGL